MAPGLGIRIPLELTQCLYKWVRANIRLYQRRDSVDLFQQKLKTIVGSALSKEQRKDVTLPITASSVHDCAQFLNIVRQER
jgi:hypothetical protein